MTNRVFACAVGRKSIRPWKDDRIRFSVPCSFIRFCRYFIKLFDVHYFRFRCTSFGLTERTSQKPLWFKSRLLTNDFWKFPLHSLSEHRYKRAFMAILENLFYGSRLFSQNRFPEPLVMNRLKVSFPRACMIITSLWFYSVRFTRCKYCTGLVFTSIYDSREQIVCVSSLTNVSYNIFWTSVVSCRNKWTLYASLWCDFVFEQGFTIQLTRISLMVGVSRRTGLRHWANSVEALTTQSLLPKLGPRATVSSSDHYTPKIGLHLLLL